MKTHDHTPAHTRVTFDRIVADNPDLSLQDQVELTANELGCDSVDVADVVFDPSMAGPV